MGNIKDRGGGEVSKVRNQETVYPSSCYKQTKTLDQLSSPKNSSGKRKKMSNCEHLEVNLSASVYGSGKLNFPRVSSYNPDNPPAHRAFSFCRGEICSMPSRLPTGTLRGTPAGCSTTWPTQSNTSTASTSCTGTSNRRTCW